MAKELARINYEKQKDEKLRQHIRANRYTPIPLFNPSPDVFRLLNVFFLSVTFSLELRELESKLKAAYLNKDRAAQIAERDVLMLETQVSASLVASSFKRCFQLFFFNFIYLVVKLRCFKTIDLK